jgi:hypothetical protein
MASLASCIAAAGRAMGRVVATVTPDFFARDLRPFFEGVHLAGQRYGRGRLHRCRAVNPSVVPYGSEVEQ